MKKFIGKIFLLFILVCILYIGMVTIVQLLPPQFSENYGAAAIDKYERLKELDSPKIILVGGSGFAFGVNSEEIEKSVGLPVVNLGLHAALESHFMLEMVKVNIGEGDIIVLALEYGIYPEKGINSESVLTTVENYPYLWKLVDVRDYPKLVREYFQVYGVTKISRFLTGKRKDFRDYNRESFNQYGDISYYRECKERTDTSPSTIISKDIVSSRVIEEINDLVKYAKERGAMVYISFPALDEQTIVSNETEIEGFVSYLQEEVDAILISNIYDYFYPSEMFYDTAYHLTTEGAMRRTKQLIEDLQTAMD